MWITNVVLRLKERKNTFVIEQIEEKQRNLWIKIDIIEKKNQRAKIFLIYTRIIDDLSISAERF